MGRKKKKNSDKNNSEEKNGKNGKMEWNIHGDAKRSIAAVFLFVLAVIFILGFFESAGVLGRYLDKIISLAFGWGKWILPLILAIAAAILLYRKETLFYVTKLIGIAAAFLAVLGFFHLFVNPEKLLEFAKSGSGGGYAGYGIAYLLIKITGTAAGAVMLAALFLVGVIAAFNFSLAGFFQRLAALNFIKRKEEISGDETAVSGIEESREAGEKEKETEFVESLENAEDNVWIEEGGKKEEPEFSVKPIAALAGKEKRRKSYGSVSKKWQFPPLDLLESSTGKASGGDVAKNAKIIHDTFRHFGIEVELGEIQVGPTVTQYSFRPAVGVKLSKITTLHNDLALALAAHPIRIEAPIPGKSLVGIEVPNKQAALVRLRNLLEGDTFKNRKSNLTLALGEDVSGSFIVSDLGKMPHLMIAGATGTGKSICINSILLTLLYQNSPEDLRLVLIDPKRVELSLYDGIPHLLSSTIVENGKALNAFKWAISEMEKRYRMLQDTGSRDLYSYNGKIDAGANKRKYVNQETGETEEEEITHLPHIVIVIDELADLMVSHGKEVEGAIIRLAQMARAVGIHLIVSTQRPSVEVLTGLIKANITTRIAFKVATQVDSRTILDAGGADKLLGNGDMLLMSSQTSKLKRIQGALVSEAEVRRVVKFVKSQGAETEKEKIEDSGIFSGSKINFGAALAANPQTEDEFYDEAKQVVIEAGKASSSLLQRRLRIGYARAARLIDMLEDQGVVGRGEGSKPREILAGKEAVAPREMTAGIIEPDNEEEKIKEEAEDNEQKERDKWQI